jgi:DNA-directed RNA polymerase specialized sigma24 family protein
VAARKKAAPKKSEPKKESVFDDNLAPIEDTVEESELLAGLSDEEKKEFSKLLAKKLSLDEMADLLVDLAHKNCTKTAAVGLRAIQEINKIRGISKDDREETSQMFVLPAGAKVSIDTTEPEE